MPSGRKIKKKVEDLLSPASSQSTLSKEDDDNLVDDLLAELDARDQTVQHEAGVILTEISEAQEKTSSKKDSRSRFQAREARKAAALAERSTPSDAAAEARIVEETKHERDVMAKVCGDYELDLCEITPDGHCLFAAIADQLILLGVLPPNANYATTRHAAASYMFSHPDDFIPFLPSLDGEDGAGATNAGLMTPAQFELYCKGMRDTAVWGGEPEIQALSRMYKVSIFVVQAEQPHIVPHAPAPNVKAEFSDPNVVRISYHRRMYGLGEHYNSLRPAAGKMHKAMDAVKAAFTSP